MPNKDEGKDKENESAAANACKIKNKEFVVQT